MKNRPGAQPPLSVFAAATVVIFFAALSAAASVGLVPYYIDGTAPSTAATAPEVEETHPTLLALAELPQLGDIHLLARGLTLAPEITGTWSASSVSPKRIIIPAIDMDLPVQNPETRDIEALDALLRSGPARYVDSARLGERGNVLIFAHSSNLPVVRNPMYKAFNRIAELRAGSTITLTGDDGVSYLYVVRTVRQVDASDTIVDLSPGQAGRLTLVTCDTLTSKNARFVLEADYIGTAN